MNATKLQVNCKDFYFFLDKPHVTADTHCPVAPAAAKQPASSFPQPEPLSSLQTAYIHALENHSWAQLVVTPAVNSYKKKKSLFGQLSGWARQLAAMKLHVPP